MLMELSLSKSPDVVPELSWVSHHDTSIREQHLPGGDACEHAAQWPERYRRSYTHGCARLSNVPCDVPFERAWVSPGGAPVGDTKAEHEPGRFDGIEC